MVYNSTFLQNKVLKSSVNLLGGVKLLVERGIGNGL